MLSLGQKSFRKELFIGFGPQNVFIYIVLDLGFHFRTEGFNHFCGGSQNQGIGWDDHALGYHRVGADDAVLADLGVVEYGGVHANEYMVRKGCAVNDGCMSDYAVITNIAGCARIGMNDRIVLDVGSSAHGDGVGIAPKNGPKPEGGILVNDDIADGSGVGCHEGGGVNLWGLL